MQKFTDLKVWQRSHALALKLYELTRAFPDFEKYGLTSQLRRAVVSVPTNLAEGSKRKTRVEYARFVNMAEASLAETEYLLILCRDLKYPSSGITQNLLDEVDHVARMLSSLRQAIEEAEAKQLSQSRTTRLARVARDSSPVQQSDAQRSALNAQPRKFGGSSVKRYSR
jgi:four helix bundle protein